MWTKRLCLTLAICSFFGSACAQELNRCQRPTGATSCNGISVGAPKVFDNRSLTLMLEALNQTLEAQQRAYIDQKSLLNALANLQGLTTQELSTNRSVAASQTTPTIDSMSKVTLDTAVEIGTPGFYRVSYSYEFPGRQFVYIRGIGTAPGKGALRYINSGKTIEFLDGPQGKTLYVATIEQPVVLMGPSLELPEQEDFPPQSRRGSWHQGSPFSERALGVLEQHFRSGYRCYESGHSIFYISTYTEVPGQSETTRVRLAVMVTYPMVNPGSINFTLSFKAQERRSHTDWRDTISDPSLQRVQTFVDIIMNELQRKGASSP